MPKSKLFDTQKALAKAQKLFWTKGYSATSINDLTENLGLSRSSIYDTYTDKYNLYLQTLEDYSKSQLEQAQAGAKSAKNQLEYVHALVRSAAENTKKPKGCYIMQAGAEFGNGDENITPIVSDYLMNLEKIILKALEAGKTAKQINKKVESKDLAKQLVAHIQLIHMYARIGRPAKELKTLADHALSAVTK